MNGQPTRDELRDDILNYLNAVVAPGEHVELRILDVVDNPKYPKFTAAGYFDDQHFTDLVDAAHNWTMKAVGVYILLNPCSQDVWARCANRVEKRPKSTTKDEEVIRRTGLLVDIDPQRPTDVSATDPEKELARIKAVEIREFLSQRGWPNPIETDSGNGCALRYLVELPTEDDGLVERCLKALAAKFDTACVKVDTSVFNAARITRLPGTRNRKGDDCSGFREHRWARLLNVPNPYLKVPLELLEELANEVSQTQVSQPTSNGSSGCDFTTPVPSNDGVANYIQSAIDGELGKLRNTSSHRNDALNDAAFAIGTLAWRTEVNEAETRQKLLEVAQSIGLDEKESLKTIRSGWESGRKKPRSLSGVRAAHVGSNGKTTSSTQQNTAASSVSPTDDDDSVPLPPATWPAPPDSQAYHGVLGEIVQKIEPCTEADPLGLLVHMIVYFGNVIGRTAYIDIEATRHYLNEFAVTVGKTGIGRKGTAADWGTYVFSTVDALWTQNRVQSGLSSGEGLISAVRDAVESRVPIREKGQIIDWQVVVSDPGANDKRLMVLEPEFGGALRALERDGNKLSAVIREAWDGKSMRTLTKNPMVATDAHVSITAHITFDELKLLLSNAEIMNGLANRFLWFAVRRQRSLPFGGMPKDLRSSIEKLVEAVEFARSVGRIGLSDAAKDLWEGSMYESLVPREGGALAAILSRGQPHVRRISGIFALSDRLTKIEPCHLVAAKALWDASVRCARHIFGDVLPDPNAQKILDALNDIAPNGLTRLEISANIFKRNVAAAKIKSALTMLVDRKLVRESKEQTGGRPAYRYFSVPTDSTNELNESNEVSHPDLNSYSSFNSLPPSVGNGGDSTVLTDSTNELNESNEVSHPDTPDLNSLSSLNSLPPCVGNESDEPPPNRSSNEENELNEGTSASPGDPPNLTSYSSFNSLPPRVKNESDEPPPSRERFRL